MNKRLNSVFLGSFILLMVVLLLPTFTTTYELHAKSQPSIYNLDVLNDIKLNPNKYSNRALFLKETDSIVELAPLSVTDKKKTYAPNNHYYCSISRYAWPDTNNPLGPYVIKDGQSNPEYSDYDGEKLDELAKRLQYLCVAYYITERSDYKRAAINQLKVWFIDKRTRMLPNFEYAQVQPGHNNNKGQSYGLVELSRFTKIVESVMLLDTAGGISRRERRRLKIWFDDFQAWLLKSKQWNYISNSNNNNITSSGYLALVEMSLFIDNLQVANRLANEYKEKIIDAQIEEDGRQPAELRRTIGFGYSVENLKEIVDFCLVMENMGGHFYNDNQQRIDAAFSYLVQFVDNHKEFPYQQEAPWSLYEKRLQKNMKRLTRFSANETRIRNLAGQIELQDNSIMDLVY